MRDPSRTGIFQNCEMVKKNMSASETAPVFAVWSPHLRLMQGHSRYNSVYLDVLGGSLALSYTPRNPFLVLNGSHALSLSPVRLLVLTEWVSVPV